MCKKCLASEEGQRRLAELKKAEEQMQQVGIPFRSGCLCTRGLHLQPDSAHTTAIVDYNVALLGVRDLHEEWTETRNLEVIHQHWEQARERGQKPFSLVTKT